MSDFSSPNDVINALAVADTGAGSRQFGIKNVLTTVAGFYYSTWLATGTNGNSTTPTAWAACGPATPGSWVPQLVDATGGATNRLLYSMVSMTVTAIVNLEDRLGHMGGLNGTLTTAQTVGATLTAAVAQGRCLATGADVAWWLEWYTATGSTAVTATITYTNQAGTTGRTTTVALPASVPASRRYPINALQSGDTSIQSIQSVTLSASTGTAGNLGVTATKHITNIFNLATNYVGQALDWAALGMPQVEPGACLCGYYLASGATAGPAQYQLVVGAR